MPDRQTRTPIGLGHLTVERLAPPDVVTQGAAAGFATTGLRFWDGFTDKESYPVWPGSPMLREILARLDDVDLVVTEIENIVLNPQTDPLNYRRMFETGALLGAQRVVIGSIVDDEALGTNLFARLCECGAEFKLDIAIEFYLKWHGCASLAQARRIVANAGQSNGKILVDALHLCRTNGRASDLAATPRDVFASLQLCDGPAQKPATLDEISHESRFARALPAEGELPLADIVRAWPEGVPITVEIPNRALEDEIGSQAYLHRCFNAADRLVASALATDAATSTNERT
jgi:sugar phosphate isomerase/epimerase